MNDYLWLIVFLSASLLAVRGLLSLTRAQRDRLHGLLVEHVQQARSEQRKKLQIHAMRQKIRERRAKDSQREATPNAAPEPQSKAA